MDGCFDVEVRLLLEAGNRVEVTLTVPNLAFHLRGAVQLVPTASSSDGTAEKKRKEANGQSYGHLFSLLKHGITNPIMEECLLLHQSVK